jgi:hypothetical protein
MHPLNQIVEVKDQLRNSESISALFDRCLLMSQDELMLELVVHKELLAIVSLLSHVQKQANQKN